MHGVIDFELDTFMEHFIHGHTELYDMFISPYEKRNPSKNALGVTLDAPRPSL